MQLARMTKGARKTLTVESVCKGRKKRKGAPGNKWGGGGGEGSVTCTKAQGKSKWYKERGNLKTMKSGTNAAGTEETRSYDEKRRKTPLLLKASVQMMKSAGKHHCYWRQAFKWWKAREKITVIIEEKRSSDEKREKSEKDSARKST